MSPLSCNWCSIRSICSSDGTLSWPSMRFYLRRWRGVRLPYAPALGGKARQKHVNYGETPPNPSKPATRCGTIGYTATHPDMLVHPMGAIGTH